MLQKVMKVKNRIFEFLSQDTLRSKVVKFTATIILFMIISYVFNFIITNRIISSFDEVFKINSELETLSMNTSEMTSNLEDYLGSKDSNSFIAYHENYSLVLDQINQMDQGLSMNYSSQTIHNISQMTRSLLEKTQDAVDLKRARNTAGYLTSLDEIKEITEIIDSQIDDLNSRLTQTNIERYQKLSKGLIEFNTLFLGLIFVLLVLSVIFVYDFTRRILRPIERLSSHAKDISKGVYDIDHQSEGTFREADILGETFKDMASNIETYIGELKNKSEVESSLAQARIDKLELDSQLKLAQLKSLQSQINPHFLFNTLNAGVQLANLEDAERTVEFIDNLSKLFRYNIQSLEKSVTLRSELKNVDSYYHLMKVRFDDMLEFHVDVKSDRIDVVMMPPLILQPIIENAIIHGFENKEDKGIVEIEVVDEGRYVLVNVKDNGKGMSVHSANSLNENGFEKIHGSHKSGHTTGLGLSNVYARLKSFYPYDDVMTIEATENKWTKVTVKLEVYEDEIQDTGSR